MTGPGGEAREKAPSKSKFIAQKQQSIESFERFLVHREAPAHPLEIFLEISNLCNLKCAMCSVFSELNPHRLLVLKSEERGFLDRRYMDALAPLLSHALLVHCYGYGEPTVHPEFVGLLDSILDFEVLVDFFTNGMNLTEELCEFLVERKIFRVTVSFSGSTREDYENVYLNGNFDVVLQGIARLSRIKAARGSRYPEIEINSIAFPHHLARIVDFVDMMAGRGVNTIYLKPLHAYGSIPLLHSHVAVMRPDVEGQLLAQAQKLACAKGLSFVDEFSNVATAATLEEEQSVRARLTWGARGEAGAEVVPIVDFKKIAKTVQPLVPPKVHGAVRAKPVTAMDQTPDSIREFLDIRAPETPPLVMCSQPFKTIYVNQAGSIRPCCFGFTDGLLGSLDANDGEAIWNGTGYSATRAAILAGEYPMKICEACLKVQSYPKSDAFWGMVSAYASWHDGVFGESFKIRPRFAQLYIDTGEGFSESRSIIHPLGTGVGRQAIEFDLTGTPVIRNLRFDPLNAPVSVTIDDAVVIDIDGRAHALSYAPVNSSAQRDGIMAFAGADPQIILAGFPAEQCRKIVLSLDYHPHILANASDEQPTRYYYAQVFIDTGQGYNEAESLRKGVAPGFGIQEIEFDLAATPRIYGLRLDPINAAATVQFHRAERMDASGAWHPLAFGESNGKERRGGTWVFQGDDPQILLANLPASKYRKVRFSVSYTLKPPAS